MVVRITRVGKGHADGAYSGLNLEIRQPGRLFVYLARRSSHHAKIYGARAGANMAATDTQSNFSSVLHSGYLTD
jgi:hypothetical protein